MGSCNEFGPEEEAHLLAILLEYASFEHHGPKEFCSSKRTGLNIPDTQRSKLLGHRVQLVAAVPIVQQAGGYSVKTFRILE